jgi:membrane fusion protein (multidrug efflux system)
MSNRQISDNQSMVSRIPLLLIAVVLVVLISYLQWPENKQNKSQFKREVAVKMTEVVLTEFVDSIEAVGTGRANEQVLLTSKYSNLISDVYFDDGQLVNRGDILVKFNNKEELAKVSELEANLSESKAQLTRLLELLTSKATSRSIVDQQSAKTKAIKAQLVSARAKLDELTIRAPFAGVLGFREVSRGSYINSGEVITSLDDLSVIKVDFFIPERLLTNIAVGQKITAGNTAYKSEKFIGEIVAIDSRIDVTTRMVKVRATIKNKALKLRPGMLLSMNVLLTIEDILQLPESAIIAIEDKHYVFVVSEGKALRKEIIIGRRQPGVVEVVSGLLAKERVVVEGALKLRDGSAVKILNTALSSSTGSASDLNSSASVNSSSKEKPNTNSDKGE